jgi:hypothetical protein
MESHPSQTLYRVGSSAILAALAARSDNDITTDYAESSVKEQAEAPSNILKTGS